MISILKYYLRIKNNVTLLNDVMEIDAAGMKSCIPTEHFILAKHYVSAWVRIQQLLQLIF